jgi:Ca2+/Na+ antiporter
MHMQIHTRAYLAYTSVYMMYSFIANRGILARTFFSFGSVIVFFSFRLKFNIHKYSYICMYTINYCFYLFILRPFRFHGSADNNNEPSRMFDRDIGLTMRKNKLKITIIVN